MVQKKFPKAKEHTDEVVALETEIMECWALVTANAHNRAVLDATRAATAPPPLCLPMHESAFSQFDFNKAALEKDKKFSSQSENYNKGKMDLPMLAVTQVVRIQDEKTGF